MAKDYLTPREVAAEVGRSEGTLSNWRVQGKGPRFNIQNGRIEYPRAEVEKYKDSIQKKIYSSTAERKVWLGA